MWEHKDVNGRTKKTGFGAALAPKESVVHVLEIVCLDEMPKI
jgi:hypothetical protein